LQEIAQAIRVAGYHPGSPVPVSGPIQAQAPVQPVSAEPGKAAGRGAGYDLVVIGSGGAAFAAAITASEMDKKVLMIERGVLGGTCVNIGCVPSKTLLRAAETYYSAGHHPFSGLETRALQADLASLVKQKDSLVDYLRTTKYEDLISQYGWQLERGEARFVDEQNLQVNGRTVTSQAYLIATGARPAVPAIAGLAEAGYLTSTSALALEQLPRSMVVIGAGYVALELGQFFHHLGVQVTLVQRSPRILKEYDLEIAEAMQGVLDRQGLRVCTSTHISQVEKSADGTRRVVATVEGREEVIEAEQILVATGRQPNTEALHLELAGVKTDQTGAIVVDDQLKTTNPRIWAAGDVTAGAKQFVYVAAYDGALAAQNALANAGRKVDLSAVPAVIFTTPQIASVGLTEEQAKAQGFEVATAVLPLKAVPRALVNHEVQGVFKLVAEATTHQLLGVQIVAENAGDVIYAGTLAVKFKLSVEDLTSTFAPYLTMAEGMKLAAQTFNRDVAKLSCCAA
jgi:mercuric reductase